jgi:O-antigen/teichoic acid export membrane protein
MAAEPSPSRSETEASAVPRRDDAVTAGRGFLVITGAKIWFMVGGAAVSFGLPYMLPVAEYGQYTDINNNLGFLSMVMVTGVTQAVARFVSARPEAAGGIVRQALALFGGIAGVLALAVFLGAGTIAEARGNVEQTTAYRFVSAIILAYGMYAVFIGALNGKKAFLQQALFDGGYTTLRAALILGGAAFLGHSVTGAFGGFAAAAVTILLLSFWRIFPQFGRGPGEPALYAFAAQVLLAQLVFQAIFRQDVLYLQPMATASFMSDGLSAAAAAEKAHEVLGHYGLATQIARLPWQGTLAITFIIFPMLSESTFAQDAERTRTYIQQTVRYSLLLIGGAAIVLAAVPEPLVRGVWKPEYAPTAIALTWLAPAYAAFAIFNISVTMLTAAGRATEALIINLMTAGLAYVSYQVFLPGVTEPETLLARAGLATALPFAFGLAAAGARLWMAYGRPFPPATVARVVGLGLALGLLGRLLPSTEAVVGALAAGGGGAARLVGLAYAAGAAGLVLVLFIVGILLSGEIGPEDRARFGRVLRRKAKGGPA